MNCISDFICDYHSKYGLIDRVNIISINNDDCAVNILSNKSLVRTSLANVKILSSSHEKLKTLSELDTKQNYILSIDNYSCMVKVVKICDDKSVEVRPLYNLLLDNEPTKRVSLECLQICGQYESFDKLKTISLPMPCEYSRYFNNINIFKPLLSHVKNVIIHWNAEDLKLKLFSFDDDCLKKIEFLMPVFISQLSILSGGRHSKSMDSLSSYIVWEYQYENEEEANYAIGPKGSHILAVRNFRGIAGVVLTKSNRLRIIAENKFALKEARSLLEIKREIYLFDDSFIPILIGKNASRISELVHKAGLHCIHVPNAVWTGVLCEHVTVGGGDASLLGKRPLALFGTHESINGAKLLLDMEESVKDLKREFELRKNSKLLRQSVSVKSSVSSVSKEEGSNGGGGVGCADELEKEITAPNEPEPEEVFDDVQAKPQSSCWANMHDDDDELNREPLPASISVTRESGITGYMDFFPGRDRNTKKVWNIPPHCHSPDTRHNNNNFRQQKRTNRKPLMPKQQQLPPGGLLFTNSAFGHGGTINDEDEWHHYGGGHSGRNSGPYRDPASNRSHNNWNGDSTGTNCNVGNYTRSKVDRRSTIAVTAYQTSDDRYPTHSVDNHQSTM